MKRFFLILLLVLTLAATAAALWGSRLVAATLDAELAPLLTRQLGLPVQLAPIETHALSLRAQSAQLVMGDPADPAVVATEVKVRLSWPELLKGKVRLVYAGADDLMVKPSRWPRSGKPAPDNYRFLDPWLPRRLQFHTGRFVTAGGGAYPVEEAAWGRRLSGGVGLSWSERRKGGLAALEAELSSLDNLLELQDFRLYLRGAIDGMPQSDFALALHIQPDEEKAYQLDGTLKAIGATLTTQATGSHRWDWPDVSNSHYTHLDPGALSDFVGLYGASGAEDTAEAFLAKPLPNLNLVPHTGSLSIDEIRVGDEIARNATLAFVADPQGLRIDPLSLQGPKANLNGSITIKSSAEGWDATLDATLQAHAGDSIGQVFAGTDWMWETGNTHVTCRGTTWGDLLYSLTGNITARGFHRGEATTPITVEAALASNTESFNFEHLKIALGEGLLQGSALLSGTDQRKLTLDLTGDKVHVDFLFDAKKSPATPGVAIPEYLQLLPDLELDWTLNVTDLHAPGLTLGSASARLERNSDRGKLVARATGLAGGSLDLTFEADTAGEKAGRYKLQTTFDRVDLPTMFQQPGVLHTRTSGSLQFEGGGEDMQDIFKNLRGTTSVAVEVRADDNWRRPARDNEKLELNGSGSFVLEGKDIVGITIVDLDIESTEQDLTGSLSMVATRKPWLIADLKSDKLDVNALRELLPENPEEADRTDFLQFARELGTARIALEVDSLTVGDAPVSRLNLRMLTDQDLFRIEEVAFSAHGSRLEGNGEIAWKDKLAKIELTMQLTDVDLDQFLIRDPTLEHVRVNGTAHVSSEGQTVAELVGKLAGQIDLASKELDESSGEPSRQLLMNARRLPDGIQADVKKLRLGKNHLTGSLRYTRADPPLLDIDINGGWFSLLPWESSHVATESAGSEKNAKQESGVLRVATTSANAVGRILRAPLRLFGTREESGKGRLFSDKPLPLDNLQKINLDIKGQLDTLESSVAAVHQLRFEGRLKNGFLSASASAGSLNGGRAKLDLDLNAGTQPANLTARADFEDVRGLTSTDTYTRSGFAAVTASGQSTAALAASLNGLVYLDLGPGPFDYRNATFLSTSISSQVFNTLIPGLKKKVPQLECGITVMEFKDGTGKTPYGYAVRTNQANLLGHFTLDLKKEEMELNFESRSREGVGLSVGNMVSNSVQVRGSFTDPYIVPRATSLAWRGWAAFMTTGLSVVAESVLKRAMASENPCPPLKKLISTELCPKSEIAASSDRMCPQGGAQG